MKTVADILEPLAERLYDAASDQKYFLNRSYMRIDASNDSVMVALEEVQFVIHIDMDPELILLPYVQIEEALRDIEDAYSYISENYDDPDAFLRIDVSEQIDQHD